MMFFWGKSFFKIINFQFCFSSVLPPKDISFFRMEKEHALRRGLQVRPSPIHLLFFERAGVKGKLIHCLKNLPGLVSVSGG